MIVQFHCSGENKDGKKTSMDFRFEDGSNVLTPVTTPLTTVEFLDFCKKCKEEEYIHLRGQLKYSVEGISVRDVIVFVYVEEDYDLKEAIKRKWGRLRKRITQWMKK